MENGLSNIERFKMHQGEEISIAPLVHFRILFGLMMALSVIRFYYYGWIETQYIQPTYFFTYLGFDWIRPWESTGMYLLFAIVFLSALGIMFGWFYRLSTILFFLSFTYIELIDKTNYLNHYYFVSLVSFLLIFLPAHRQLSLDVLRKPRLTLEKVPRWTVNVIKLQLAMVYIFAGIAKLQPDWLLEAMPLKLWLPAQSHVPVIGWLLNYEWTAYLFSWAGALYDLFIVFFLLYPPTRILAYLAVIGFHVATAILFPIGLFPYVMIVSTLLFFSPESHQQLLSLIKNKIKIPTITRTFVYRPTAILKPLLLLFFVIQLLLPFRYLTYPGPLFWTEQGYRFSWRVMLMEKAGHTVFMVTDKWGNKKEWVNNYDYLAPQQEKMMSTQPDMILQFAHHLAAIYEARGYEDPIIKCDSRVTLNGTRSQPLVDPDVNLAAVSRGFAHKQWILPFQKSLNHPTTTGKAK